MAVTTAPVKQRPRVAKTISYSGGVSTADNDVLLELDVDGVSQIIFGTTAGAVDVLGSLDGTNFLTTPLALTVMGSATPGTRVLLSAANGAYLVDTVLYRKLRFLQNGATATANFSLVGRLTTR